MSDRFDAPAVSDFPTDPVANHDVLFWIVTTVCLIVLASFLTVWFKRSERQAGLGIGDAIEARANAVMKALSAAAKAGQDEQINKAEDARAVVRDQFAETLALSAELSKVVGKLNGAIEGTREEAYKGGSGNGPAHVSGGTVINIAVNGSGDAQAVASPYGASAPVHTGDAPEKVAMTPDEKSESVWKAVQKLFNYWKNRAAVIAAFRAAQQQLMASPRWEDPREDERDPSRPRKS